MTVSDVISPSPKRGRAEPARPPLNPPLTSGRWKRHKCMHQRDHAQQTNRHGIIIAPLRCVASLGFDSRALMKNCCWILQRCIPSVYRRALSGEQLQRRWTLFCHLLMRARVTIKWQCNNSLYNVRLIEGYVLAAGHAREPICPFHYCTCRPIGGGGVLKFFQLSLQSRTGGY